MRCDHARDLLDLQVDGELGVLEERELQAHLAACEHCSAILLARRELVTAVRALPVWHADASMRTALDRALDEADAESLASARSAPAVRRRKWLIPRWLGAGAVLACTALFSSLLTVRFMAEAPEQSIERSLVSDHLRALASAHLTDVESSDRHTVKPWFSGRLSYSPPVRDLAEEGFSLIGARVEILDGRTIAALVYQRRLHVISVFVWPATRQQAALSDHDYQGIHNVRWVADGFNFWVVSDLADDELTTFARALRHRVVSE
jgi:anti-sigma factor RsiW